MSSAEAFEFPAEVQAIHDVFHRHVRYYPQLTDAFDGNVTAAIVFVELLYLDSLRINAGAAWFTQTDKQLAGRLSIGVRAVQAARDLITAPGIGLFKTELHGMPAIKHYAGDYERINAWLEMRGIGRVTGGGKGGGAKGKTKRAKAPAQFAGNRQTGLPISGKLDSRKTANMFAGNRTPLKNTEQEQSVVDDAARGRAFEIRGLLSKSGVEGDNLTRLTAQLLQVPGAAEQIAWEAERTLAEKVADKAGRIKSVTGMFVTRMRDWYAGKTGHDPRYVEETLLAAVRETFAEMEVTMH